MEDKIGWVSFFIRIYDMVVSRDTRIINSDQFFGYFIEFLKKNKME